MRTKEISPAGSEPHGNRRGRRPPAGSNAPELRAARRLGRDPDVLWIALFGSRARGEHRPDSDADLAVGTTAGFTPERRQALALRLERAWRVPGIPLDLVFADPASPLLRFEIASTGRLLAARHPLAWPDFRERAHTDYLDELPTIRFHQEVLLRRIREWGHGP